MLKRLLIVVFITTSFIGFAQDDEEEETPKEGWTKTGNISLLFNQAAFNAEWQGGGVSNVAGNLKLNYDFNYRKGKIGWDNKMLAEYGITKIESEKNIQKTNDRLEYTSILGKQIKESLWSYSIFLNFKTQFDSGYEETGREVIVNGETITITDRTRNSKFFSPAYLQLGPGLFWKKSDNLKVNIAPLAARFIFVDGQFTDPNDPRNRLDENMEYFGVSANETLRFEFGVSVNGYAKFDLMPNISMENLLNLYSDYLSEPQNVKLDYTMNLIMSVNKWITANLTFQAIYEDIAIQGFQIREALGIGVTYGF
jgi:DUF3078 family protein